MSSHFLTVCVFIFLRKVLSPLFSFVGLCVFIAVVELYVCFIYILDVNPYLTYMVCKIFSHWVGCCFSPAKQFLF